MDYHLYDQSMAGWRILVLAIDAARQDYVGKRWIRKLGEANAELDYLDEQLGHGKLLFQDLDRAGVWKMDDSMERRAYIELLHSVASLLVMDHPEYACALVSHMLWLRNSGAALIQDPTKDPDLMGFVDIPQEFLAESLAGSASIASIASDYSSFLTLVETTHPGRQEKLWNEGQQRSRRDRIAASAEVNGTC